MALVSYDYESGSEGEEQEEPSTSSEVIINSTKVNNSEANEVTTELPEILSHLPQTKTTTPTVNVTEDKLEDFIPKYEPPPKENKKTQKVKITIPKLSEFEEEEEEEPQRKKTKTVSKSSGLLSMLPPVKGSPLSTKSFVPNVLKNKPPVTQKSKANSLVPHAVKKKAEMAKKAAIKKITKGSSSDAESDDDIEVPETFDDEMWQKVCGRNTKPKPPPVVNVEEVAPPVINIAPEPVKPYDGLDNAAFKELVGKAKRPVNIKLVDINEEEILPDKEIWMTKSLTDPDSAPKPVVEEPVDPTRKKKHHITYLAEQAKLNEQEFQSQWSASKYARNQTRAKYGF